MATELQIQHCHLVKVMKRSILTFNCDQHHSYNLITILGTTEQPTKIVRNFLLVKNLCNGLWLCAVLNLEFLAMLGFGVQ